MTKPKDLIELAAIANAHGIKGQVLIKPFGADPLALKQYGPLSDAIGQQTFTIKKLRANNKGMLVATLKEVTDRTQAESLKGTVLCIDRSKLPQPDEDEFYYSDLIGKDARLENNELFGKVINVADFGGGDLLEIMPQNSQKSMYLLFTKQTVPSLHLSEGYITIAPPQEIEVKQQEDEGQD